MSRLRPFGDNPHRQYLGMSISCITGHLESLINDEEERGDISAQDKTPRGRRLNAAYEALDRLYEVIEMGGES